MKHEMKLLAASALLVASSAASAGVIDLFSTSQTFLADTIEADGIGLSNWVDTAGDDILGGSRDLYVETITSAAGGISQNASIGVAADNFFFSVDAGATGMGIVQWDGADHDIALDVTGLGNYDLTFGGVLNSFVIDVVSADLGFNFVIEAYTDANTWTKASLLSTAGSGSAVISYADFGNCGLVDIPSGILSITCGSSGAVDFANLGALQAVISPGGNSGTLDMRLEAITVPEPSVLGLIGAGLLAGGFAARTRRNRKVNLTA